MAAAEFDRFLAGVDDLSGLAAVTAGWEAVAGSAGFAAGRPFLRPRAEIARSVPGPDGGLPLEVVEHPGGDLVGVSPDGGVVPLTRDQLVVYEVDRGRLARAVAAAFGLDPPAAGSPPARVVGAGRLLTPGGAYPCLLAFPHAGEDLDTLAARLVAAGEAPFVLFAPTRRWAGRLLEPGLRLRQSAFVPLAGAVAPAGRGRLRAVRPLADQVARALGVTGPVAPPSAADPDYTRNVFRRAGDRWVVRFGGKTVYLANDLGVRYLAALIAAKPLPIPAAILHASARGGPVPPPAAGVEILDRAAFEAARAAYADAARELDDAKACNDPGRVERAEAELAALAGQVRAATGYGGRRRETGAAAEKARVAVKNAITRVTARLAREHAELAGHFDRSVETGSAISYAPAPDVAWDL
ncbi:hypothetical protein J0H58_18765 [bacterium]|nr:hypothetical protein [bacterium]